jgi:hypothetical protein
VPRRLRREMQANLYEIERALDQIDRRAEKLETILLVRDPGSSAAAEAYDGLRKQLVSAVSDHLARLSQLVQIDRALRLGADVTVIQSMVEGWFESAGLVRASGNDETQADLLYELVEDLGGALEILEAAYVESATGRVIRQGRARRIAPGFTETELPEPVAPDLESPSTSLETAISNAETGGVEAS